MVIKVFCHFCNIFDVYFCSLQAVGLFNQAVGLEPGMGKGLSSLHNIQTHCGLT